mgnify:CR=1 FL=1
MAGKEKGKKYQAASAPPAAAKAPPKRRPRPARKSGPGLAELEELFWECGLDLLVDGRRQYLGAEHLELMLDTRSRALTPLGGGSHHLLLGRQLFLVGPYEERVDGHPVRWIGERSPGASEARPAAADPSAVPDDPGSSTDGDAG